MSFWTELTGVPFRVDWLNVGGIRTRYLEAGSGEKTVVFLHGTAGHLETFLRNIGPHALEYRVLAIDLLGHGYTDKPDYDYEIARYIEHVRGFLEIMKVKKAHLAGTSLGGWVSARIAASSPDLVDKLALISAGGLTATPAVMAAIKTLSTNAATGDDREAVRKRLQWVIKHPHMVDDELLETRWRIYTQPLYQKAIPHIMCLQDITVRTRNMLSEAELNKIAAPTIVVWTRDDPTASVETGRRYADAIPGAKFVVFEESSHLPQFEEPAKMNTLLLDFWRS
jgi:2-hydroxy-6-oxonona-2,4-dienedioate hydrolase